SFPTTSAEWPTFRTASESRSLETPNLSAQYCTSYGSLRLIRERSAGPLFVRSSAIVGTPLIVAFITRTAEPGGCLCGYLECALSVPNDMKQRERKHDKRAEHGAAKG